MNNQLDQLDLFKLLRLDHLSEEEKQEYSANLLAAALEKVVEEDLPLFLTPEEMDSFNELFSKEESREQAVNFLKEKVPDLDTILKDKVLLLKKDIVRANIEERLDIAKLAKNQEEQINLEKILAAIDADDWTTVSSLINFDT